jgi:L-seryl-tRNA(Ser) seleniumtransferase
MSGAPDALRRLPAVHACLEAMPPEVARHRAGPRLEKAALRSALDVVRARIGDDPTAFGTEAEVVAAVFDRWESELAELLRPALGPLVNATGVVVHTNLGRAPLAPEAARAAALAAERYTALEIALETGERGSRYARTAALLRAATGAEDALVVNNNAAALLLAVDTLAGSRAVAVSRGELIEIGGGFRIHEILTKSSARVVEVGATNKTHASDYEAAIAAGEVAALLKVHRSNFAQTGFVAEVSLEELCRIGEGAGLPVLFDQGTGILEPFEPAPGEPSIRAALEAGAALVCASGDKLLGGPQSGIVVGSAAWIGRLRANPLLRALRVDKMTLAALDATLRLWLQEPARVPVRRMIAESGPRLEARARAIVALLGDAARERCEVVEHAGRTGGGTLPALELPGWAVCVRPPGSAARLEAILRSGEPPIMTRVADGAVWIDARTLLDGDEEIVAARLDEALGAEKGGAR